MPTPAYAAMGATSALVPHTITRRDPGPDDVAIDILFCGVCHSDIHLARSEWFPVQYPVVPGHEIVGLVRAVGGEVKRFRVGQLVGVGCLVDSCRECPSCKEDLENNCTGGFTMTYGSPDPISGGMTFGGYSTAATVDQAFVVSVPGHLDPAEAASLGASQVVISTNDDQMAAAAGTLDFVMDTASGKHDLNPYVNTLTRDGIIGMVGVSPEPLETPLMGMVFGRKSIAGSLIGGIKETQEMLDFCGTHGITARIETIPMSRVNEARDRVLNSDIRYRFVIDMASLAIGSPPASRRASGRSPCT
jgi:uncharacterized zinc-type alcohol dehydrogenase-like protein